jgi:hypothetical protein
MRRPLARLYASLMLALATSSAYAQAEPVGSNTGTTTVLPVLSNENGEVAALLLIEPSSLPALPSQRIIRPAPTTNRWLDFGNGLQLRAGLSFDANPGIGVLCNDDKALTSVVSLAGHCMLADLNGSDRFAPGSSRNGAGVLQLKRGPAQLNAGLGLSSATLGDGIGSISDPATDHRLLNSLLGPGANVDERNASLVGQMSIGSQGWVSIGGTVARARLIPAGQLPGGLPQEWNKGSLNFSAGSGSFGGEITGQMIEIPGQSTRYSTFGASMTWRTPWRARVTVGADNLLSRGKNPFAPADAPTDEKKDEGRVPYVRYQQDL